jgi:Ca2+-binding RTX toxin-like protein
VKNVLASESDGRFPSRLGTALGALVLVLFLSAIPPSHATFSSCSYIADQKTISFWLVTPTQVRMFVASDGEIKWKEPMTSITSTCQGATVENTDTIDVDDFNSTESARFIIDLQRHFAPGTKTEPSGISEIEFSVDMGDGFNTFEIWGGDRNDRIVFGSAGINLNRDGDVDVQVEELDDIIFRGQRGADLLSAAGGFGTGDPGLKTTLYGDGGRDDLLGSAFGEILRGLGGNDYLEGNGGADTLFSEEGADVLKGEGGDDELDGQSGNDRLRGGIGGDDLDGGVGEDDCDGGPGADTVTRCE